MAKKQTDSVTSLIESAASDVTSLVEEMEEWQSNMEGASMDHLPKFEQVSECVDALQGADLQTYADYLVEALGKADALGLTFDEQITHVVSTAKRKTRADRLGEACGYLEMALDAIAIRTTALRSEMTPEDLNDQETEAREDVQPKLDTLDEVESAADDVRNAWDVLLGVEFPGAFGS